MPNLSRRRLLQSISAASLLPLVPALPISSASASVARTPSQMLWASMSTRAGSAPVFANLAGTMGISSTTAETIYAKSIGTRALAVQTVSKVSRVRRPAQPSVKPSSKPQKALKNALKLDDQDQFLDEIDDKSPTTEQQSSKMPEGDSSDNP